MKNKRSITLFFALLCVIVLLAALIWSCAKAPETEGGKDQNSSQTDPSDSSADQPSTDEPSSDQSSTDEPSEKPEEDKPDEKPDSDSGDQEPTTRTKAEIEAILNDPFMIFVNRDHRVSKDYVPEDLVTYSGSDQLNRTCADALRKLIRAGEKAGYNYTLYSGYRSYSRQYNKYYNKIAYWEDEGYSNEEAIRLTNQYYAPPGASEHHTGLAADVCIPEIVNKYACLHEAYDKTEEFKWFSAHAHEYGFILRYPDGGEDITGYSYEPWHYRYVGVEIATEIYNRGITMEEYVEELQNQLASFE